MIKLMFGVVFTAVLFLVLPFRVWAVECIGKTYADSTYLTETKRFSIYNKVFLKVHCTGIERGRYAINTDWVSPAGELIRKESIEFDNDISMNRTFFLWFKLFRKGPLERTFSNEDFESTYYGTWEVVNYFNGVKVANTHFDVY